MLSPGSNATTVFGHVVLLGAAAAGWNWNSFLIVWCDYLTYLKKKSGLW
jgi:hypothetical protein